MASNNETVSSQMQWAGNIAKFIDFIHSFIDDVVIKLGERLDVPIAKEEIDISHKLYNGKTNRREL